MSDELTTRFGFHRIIVQDLHKQAAFYRAMFGYGEGFRVDADIRGRPVEEIIFTRPDGQVDMALIAYTDKDDGPAPSLTGAFPCFYASDLDELAKRVVAAGGEVFQPPIPLQMPQGTTRLAMFQDLEGCLIEVIEQKPQG